MAAWTWPICSRLPAYSSSVTRLAPLKSREQKRDSGIIGARLAIKNGARLVRAMVLIVSSLLVLKIGFDLIRGS